MPAVSVILPVYNREALVERALASVLQQSYRDLEVLVVDDGSTDGTAERVAACPDPRVRLIRRDRNYGQASARNLGVARAQGWLLAFQDSDDEWLPDRSHWPARVWRWSMAPWRPRVTWPWTCSATRATVGLCCAFP